MMSSESESPAPPSPSPSLSPGAIVSSRNPSRSPPRSSGHRGGSVTDDNKFTYNHNIQPKDGHGSSSGHGTPKMKDHDTQHSSKEPQTKASLQHKLSSGLQVSLATANAPVSSTSTPLASNIMNEIQWHAQQTPPGGPHSPGALSWGGEPLGATSSDKSSETGAGLSSSRLSRKESYKAQRQHYRREKKRAASALLSSLEDPSVMILADWLKVRGSLKSWTKLWCVLKPGLLLIYKNPKTKSNQWVGTVLLSACQVIERPSKKDGFCFKLYNPMEQSIWAPRGPHNETIGAVIQPLPTAHLIFRAPSQAAGKCWLDGLELALKCSNMLLRSGNLKSIDTTANHETQWSPEDLEKHFHEQDIDGVSESDSEPGEEGAVDCLPNASLSTIKHNVMFLDRILAYISDVYLPEANDHVGQFGEVVEELAEENKSLLWFLIKQVRPGMDLSKVVLPTFILEPRSFLDKLSDSFYHSDMLANICQIPDGYSRMRKIVQWYLSGLYRKPKGLKKPYNPVLGEVFRCSWIHPDTDSRTYYIAEQVSHHPPVSSFYVSNRKEGFVVEATILAKSKFYGNSTSAILEGCARLTLLPLGETYFITFPFAHCKGLLLGTLSMELGGRVVIACPSTHHVTDIEFRLKPFIGGSDSINMVSGRIKHNKETLANIEGHWDGCIEIKDRRTQEESVLLDVNELKLRRLKRMLVTNKHQGPFESQRLWEKVTVAIDNEDQVTATEEKTIIEEAQRERARGNAGREWEPKHFIKGPTIQIADGISFPHSWQYKHSDLRPWTSSSDVLEYEKEFELQTLTVQDINAPDMIDNVVHHDDFEHSASETDSTNSHRQHRPQSSQQTVAAALMRVEAVLREHGQELAGVREMVRRLENKRPEKSRNVLLSWTTITIMVTIAIVLHFTSLWFHSH